MGVFYVVEPLDDELREWAEREGVALPPGRGKRTARNPTPAEIRAVCAALDGYRVTYNASTKHKFWQADVEGATGANSKSGTLLNIDQWGGSETRRYKIFFEKGDPALILRIIHGLSAQCGPLAIIPDTGEAPVVAWAEADFKKLLKRWEHAQGYED